MAIYKKIKQMHIKFKPGLDPRIRDLILRILQFHPQKRLPINKILTAPVFIPYLIKFNEPHLIVDPTLSRLPLMSGNKRTSVVIGRKQNPQDDLNTLSIKQKKLLPGKLKPQTSKSKSPNILHRSNRFRKEKGGPSKFGLKSKRGKPKPKPKPKATEQKRAVYASKMGDKNLKKSEHQKKNSLKYPKDYVYEMSGMEPKKEQKKSLTKASLLNSTRDKRKAAKGSKLKNYYTLKSANADEQSKGVSNVRCNPSSR